MASSSSWTRATWPAESSPWALASWTARRLPPGWNTRAVVSPCTCVTPRGTAGGTASSARRPLSQGGLLSPSTRLRCLRPLLLTSFPRRTLVTTKTTYRTFFSLSAEPYHKEVPDDALHLPLSTTLVLEQVLPPVRECQHGAMYGDPGAGKNCFLRAAHPALPHAT